MVKKCLSFLLDFVVLALLAFWLLLVIDRFSYRVLVEGYVAPVDRFFNQPSSFRSLMSLLSKDPPRKMYALPSFLDPAFSQVLYRQISALPPVRRVTRVEKYFPGRPTSSSYFVPAYAQAVVIRYEERQPFVVWRFDPGGGRKSEYCVLDSEGVVLSVPQPSFSLSDMNLPLLYVAGPSPVPARLDSASRPGSEEAGIWLPGDRLDTPGIQAGLSVLSRFKQQLPESFSDILLVSVDLEHKHGNRLSDVVLWLKNGVAMEWGKSRYSEGFSSISAQTKMENAHRLWPWLMHAYIGDHKIQTVRIQFDQPTFLFQPSHLSWD